MKEEINPYVAEEAITIQQTCIEKLINLFCPILLVI